MLKDKELFFEAVNYLAAMVGRLEKKEREGFLGWRHAELLQFPERIRDKLNRVMELKRPFKITEQYKKDLVDIGNMAMMLYSEATRKERGLR